MRGCSKLRGYFKILGMIPKLDFIEDYPKKSLTREPQVLNPNHKCETLDLKSSTFRESASSSLTLIPAH